MKKELGVGDGQERRADCAKARGGKSTLWKCKQFRLVGIQKEG